MKNTIIRNTYLSVILFSLLIGCSVNKEIQNDQHQTVNSIPPGQCRIVAQVIKIDSSLIGISPTDPCSKANCFAWIIIKKIIRYGSGSSVLNINDTLKTKFAFTLNPASEKNFPRLKENLPGLTEGSLFEANIQLLPNIPETEIKGRLFLVNG
ncbi:MAG: hypothetical protein C4539_11225, partial [Ignavibacteriales bacterium]